MGTACRRTSLAQDTSGTPSLVRPSRRPPPDPAPKPPLEAARTAGGETARRRSPVRYHRGGRANRGAWPHVTPRNYCVCKPRCGIAPATGHGNELEVQFAGSVGSGSQAVTKPTDIVTNMLRPAKSAPRTADKPTPTNVVRTEAIRRAESNARLVPDTSWIAKRTSPSSTAPSVSTHTVPADQKRTSAIAVETGDSATSNVVANTFGGVAGKSNAGRPASPAATGKR